jgi:subtilisin-like proprotein convertase family protein
MKKYNLEFHSILLVGAFLFATVQAASALTVTFPGSSGVTIPLSGTGTPYPATATVSGLSGRITDINVIFTGLTHTFINDVGGLLLGPVGQSVVLFDGVGGNTAVNNVNIVFDDQASASLPSGAITSGTYKPTNLIPSDIFPPSAPGGPYGSLLSVFNGTNPNGTWRLFINDFAIPDGGSIAGFSLQITIVPEPASLFLLGIGFFTVAALRRREGY